MILSGVVRLGRDAQVQVTSKGDKALYFSAAFNYGRKGQDGNRPAQWVALALYGERAEKLAPYFVKGAQVWISATEPHIETFDKNDGTPGVALKAIVQNCEFVGAKHAGDAQPDAQLRPEQNAPRGRVRSGPSSKFDALEDDIPF